MKTIALAGALVALLSAPASARFPGSAYPDDADQLSRTVVHKDGTYTTSNRDTSTRTLIRQTKRKNGTMVMRSEFVLDEFGRERKGRVFDGLGNLLFISEFIYEGGELIEERVFDARGKIVRRLLYKTKVAGAGGKMRPTVVTYQNGRPIGDLVAMDDPGVFSTTSSHAHSGESPGTVVHSADGSSVRLDGGSVRYRSADQRTASSGSSNSGSRFKRLRIFRRDR